MNKKWHWWLEALTSGRGCVSSVSTVTDSGTSIPASPDSLSAIDAMGNKRQSEFNSFRPYHSFLHSIQKTNHHFYPSSCWSSSSSVPTYPVPPSPEVQRKVGDVQRWAVVMHGFITWQMIEHFLPTSGRGYLSSWCCIYHRCRRWHVNLNTESNQDTTSIKYSFTQTLV